MIGTVPVRYDCARASSCFEIAHLVRGRLRLRLLPTSAGRFFAAEAFLSSHAGVTDLRANHRCLSLAIRFDPERVSPQALVAALSAYLGVTNDQPRAVGNALPALARAFPAIVLDILDPPGMGLIRDVVVAVQVVRSALRELRVRAWPQVVRTALARLVLQCCLLDWLVPARLRLLLHLGRAVLAIRSALLASPALAPASSPTSSPALRAAA
jgi:hypothetical protein